MATIVTEYTSYPVSVTITRRPGLPDGTTEVVPKARITFRDGDVGVYAVGAPAPAIFTAVLEETVERGQVMYRYGNEVEIELDDGTIVRASAPQGCGCGDPGKKYLWPVDTGGIVYRG